MSLIFVGRCYETKWLGKGLLLYRSRTWRLLNLMASPPREIPLCGSVSDHVNCKQSNEYQIDK
jgi:hypothetical protein